MQAYKNLSNRKIFEVRSSNFFFPFTYHAGGSVNPEGTGNPIDFLL